MKALWPALTILLLTTVDVSAQTAARKKIVLDEFGTCVVRQSPKLSLKLMATEPGNPEEIKAATTLAKANNQCLRGRAFLSGHVGEFRGAVAEALFARDVHLLQALAEKQKTPSERPAAAEGRAFAVAYATCLTRTDPRSTVGLLLTVPTTAEERSAFIAYGEALKDCMPMGQSYKVDITDIRNQIAAIAYRDVMPQTKG